MKKIFLTFLLVLTFLVLISCAKQEKKPFGAADINYEDIEKLAKEGPVIESVHKENTAPFSPYISTPEYGPMSSEDSHVSNAPIADKEFDPDYGGIPIVTKESSRDVESETNES